MDKLKMAMEQAKANKMNSQHTSVSMSKPKTVYDDLLTKKPGSLKIRSNNQIENKHDTSGVNVSDSISKQNGRGNSNAYSGSSSSLFAGTSASLTKQKKENEEDEHDYEETMAILQMKAEVLEKLRSGEISDSARIDMSTLSSFPSDKGNNLIKRGKIVVDASIFDFNGASKKRSRYDIDDDDDGQEEEHRRDSKKNMQFAPPSKFLSQLTKHPNHVKESQALNEQSTKEVIDEHTLQDIRTLILESMKNVEQSSNKNVDD